MNTAILKGKWKQMSGSAKEKWGKLTDDELRQIDGETERLVGKVQEKYGIGKDEAQKQVDEWFDKHDTD
tara:strand:- start:2933 stop:3139 length:207 start_codon:yes stop_codon:yes gene_type:complete